MPGIFAHVFKNKVPALLAPKSRRPPRERLRQLEVENDIKQRSFELREREIDTQTRERERALADARDHLLSLSKALSREQTTNQAQERRIADLRR